MHRFFLALVCVAMVCVSSYASADLGLYACSYKVTFRDKQAGKRRTVIGGEDVRAYSEDDAVRQVRRIITRLYSGWEAIPPWRITCRRID